MFAFRYKHALFLLDEFIDKYFVLAIDSRKLA